MVKKKDQEEELYDILTVSLPGENIKINEAWMMISTLYLQASMRQ